MKYLRILLLIVIVAVVAGFGYASVFFPMEYRSMDVDKDAVWMATKEGLLKYDKTSGTFRSFPSDTYSDLLSVAVSADGEVAVGCESSAGVAAFDGTDFTPVATPFKTRIVLSLAYSEGLWIGAYMQAFHKCGDVWNIFDSPEWYSSTFAFRDFAYDARQDRMWFGVAGASLKSIGYVNRKGKMTFINNYNDLVNGIYHDSQGKLYIASSNGMYVCENDKISAMEHPALSSGVVYRAVTGYGNDVWFSSGSTLIRYDGRECSSYECVLSDTEDDYIVDLAADGDKVWVLMAYGGLFEFRNGNFSAPTPGITGASSTVQVEPIEEEDPTVFRDFAVDGTSVWLATADGLKEYDKQTGYTRTFSTERFMNLSAVAISPDKVVTVGALGNSGVAELLDGVFNPLSTGEPEIVDVAALAYSDGLWIGSENSLKHKIADGWHVVESPDVYSAYNQYTCLAYDDNTDNMLFGAYSTRDIYKSGYVNKDNEAVFSTSPFYNLNSIYISPDVHCYFATENGLYTDGDENNPLYPYMSEIGCLGESVQAVTGNADSIWFAYGNKLGQCTRDDYRTFECSLSDYPDDCIVRLAVDGDRLWVLMSKSGLFEFGDSEFHKVNLDQTGVFGVEVDEDSTSRMYDLFGRAIASPAKGQVYILDGKKYIGR